MNDDNFFKFEHESIVECINEFNNGVFSDSNKYEFINCIETFVLCEINYLFEEVDGKKIIDYFFDNYELLKESERVNKILDEIIDKFNDIKYVNIIKKILDIDPNYAVVLDESFLELFYNGSKNSKELLDIFNGGAISIILEKLFVNTKMQSLDNKQQLTLLKNIKELCGSNKELESFDYYLQSFFNNKEVSTYNKNELAYHMLSVSNIPEETDSEFEELLNELMSLVYQNPNYPRLNSTFIITLKAEYNKNPELAKTSLRVLIDNIRKGVVSNEMIFDYYAYIANTKENVEGSIYDHDRKCISIIGTDSIGCFSHEIGHMIHDLLDKLNLPVGSEKFGTIMDSLATDEKLKMVEQLHIESENITKQVREGIANSIETDEFFIKFFNDYDFATMLRLFGLPYETYMFILENASEEYKNEFVQALKEAIIDYLTSVYMNINFAWIAAISDIMDAAFEGDLFDNYDMPGHGSGYYSGDNQKRFTETFANYYLIKSLCPEKIDLLKNILGEELVAYMDNYLEVITQYYSNQNKLN